MSINYDKRTLFCKNYSLIFSENIIKLKNLFRVIIDFYLFYAYILNIFLFYY